MLLFKKAFWAGLTTGAITLTFRRWQKPHVRTGGRYRCHPIGVLEVDAVERVAARAITADDAKRAGFATIDELRSYLAELGPLSDDDELWRVELHHGGDGDRVELALADQLSAADIEAITKKLDKLDGKQPWTDQTLAIIGNHPRVAASKLAAKLGRETQPFKIDVRKLKKLGLTQSFEVGYEISPRGMAYLAARPKRATGAKAQRAKQQPIRANAQRATKQPIRAKAQPRARRSRSLRKRV